MYLRFYFILKGLIEGVVFPLMNLGVVTIQ
jgi:hypothetical protein